MKKTFESMTEKATFEYARAMGKQAKAGDVIALTGEMGAGKTVFAKGFADGLGISETVSSPTFTLVQIYDDGRLPLYHFDVYRIADESEMDETGFEDYISGEGITLVEWADRIQDMMPDNTIWIRMYKDPEVDMDYRRLEIEDTVD
ncbi:MAG: tRNA (adenosine(37)-N6)-threonylcarbamoyltransferase complex ATPase subunit type 1 TsaE [Lachnospiraceae bacterium]|nr:tRNA (adenosine(37)-N6)-threonylcarbamoyltransferase complex ATPase subunit type 1 TsaE [Lachnospiraceae bacterium]